MCGAIVNICQKQFNKTPSLALGKFHAKKTQLQQFKFQDKKSFLINNLKIEAKKNLQQLTLHHKEKNFFKIFLSFPADMSHAILCCSSNTKKKGKIRKRKNFLFPYTHVKRFRQSVGSESMNLLPKSMEIKFFSQFLNLSFLNFSIFFLLATPLDLLPSSTLIPHFHSLDTVVILQYRFSSHNDEENFLEEKTEHL